MIFSCRQRKFALLTLQQERVPSAKKRKTRKPTFLDVSTNAPLSRVTRGKKSAGIPASTQEPEKRQLILQEPRHPVFLQNPPTINPLVAFGNRFPYSMEEDDDFKSLRDMGKKPGFNVFHDGPEISPGM